MRRWNSSSTRRSSAPGEVRTQAPVDAAPEAEVTSIRPAEHDRVRVGVLARVAVRARDRDRTGEPAGIVWPPSSTSVVVMRGTIGAGSSSRRISSTTFGIVDGSSTIVARNSGWRAQVEEREPDGGGHRVESREHEQERESEQLLVGEAVVAERDQPAEDVVARGSLRPPLGDVAGQVLEQLDRGLQVCAFAAGRRSGRRRRSPRPSSR